MTTHTERTTEVRTHTEARTTATTAATPTVKYIVHQPVPVPTVPQPSVMLIQPQTFIQYAPHYVTVNQQPPAYVASPGAPYVAAVSAPHRVDAPLTPGTYVVPGHAASTAQVRTSTDRVMTTRSVHDVDLQLEEVDMR